MSALQIRGVTAAYGGPSVLRGIDLEVADGDLACLVGPSGSGKSTLLRCVAGLHPTATGTVIAGGRPLDGLRPEQRRIGLVPQDAALFTHLDVERNVGYGLFRLGRRERRARVAELLELTGLADLGRRMPYELSGGQQQRSRWPAPWLRARSCCCWTSRSAGSTPSCERTCASRSARCWPPCAPRRCWSATIATRRCPLADQVVVMRDGEIRQAGHPTDVYRHPADVWTGQFVGDAVVLAAVGRRPRGDRAGWASCRWRRAQRGPVTVLLRPEQLRLRPDPVATANHAVTVTELAYRGRDWRVRAVTDAGEPVIAWWAAGATMAGVDAPAVGDRLAVTVEGTAVAFVG